MPQTPPNILILHCDQLRYDALGCTGHGVWGNGVPLNRREYLPFAAFQEDPANGSIPELPTFADLLAEAGYATGAFGKLHLTPSVEVPGKEFPESDRRWASGVQDDWHGPYFGFQHVELTHAHGECPGGHYEAWLRDTHPERYRKVRDNQETAERPIEDLGDLHPSVLTYDTHPSPWIGRRGLAWMEAQSKPFCAFLGFPDPHHAFSALEEDLAHFDGVEMRPPTDAMVRTIDRAVGEVIEGLKAAGKWENTVVLFTSDHGDYLGDHGRLRKSHRAAEQLLHVPCILKLPDDLQPETSRLEMATSNIDILPTLMALAGVNVPDHLQGVDLLAEGGVPRYALAHGFNGNPEGANFSLMDERFRYTVYPRSGYKELFDHSVDRLECRNLSEDPEYAVDMERLHAALAEAQLRAVNPISGRLASW